MQLIKVKSNFPIKLSVLTPLNYSKVIILPKANIHEGNFYDKECVIRRISAQIL